MNKEEREILIGKHTVCLGEDNILYITIVGDIDEEKIEILFETISKLLEMGKGKVSVLVNISKAKKPSVKTRNHIAQFHTNKKVGQIAIFGLTPVAKVMSAFAVGITKKRNIKFFDTKESALAWLNE
ncbi:MAG: STAS/SEC14 domain-containing protein [bacterium]|nr:STAS/SEC14 domain-containing protein [bacterium]